MFIISDHVKLKSFRVRRRHAGQCVTKIGDVIRQNATSLREISRVGISEASHGFSEKVLWKFVDIERILIFQLKLDKFGCMSFDLGFQPAPNQIPHHFIRFVVGPILVES